MPEELRITIALVATSFLFTVLIAMLKRQQESRGHGDDWQPDFEFAFKVVGSVWILGAVVVGFIAMWEWAL